MLSVSLCVCHKRREIVSAAGTVSGWYVRITARAKAKRITCCNISRPASCEFAPDMVATKSRTGNALGLTSQKARSSSAARGKPKGVSDSVNKDVKVASKKVNAESEERTYPKELLKLAEGRPELDVNSPKYNRLWEETRKQMGRAAGKYIVLTKCMAKASIGSTVFCGYLISMQTMVLVPG